MATYSSNTTIKVGSSIAQAASNGGSFSYTVPAGSYAMITSLSTAAGFGGFGQILITAPNNHVIYNHNETLGSKFDNYSDAPLYLPSGTVISGITGGIAPLGGVASMNGILFQNTP